MSQCTSHRNVTTRRPIVALADVLRLRSQLIIALVLVLLITNGGAG